MLKEAGYFEELKYGDKSCGSLKNSVNQEPHEFEARIIHYLESGHCLAAAPGILRDVLSDVDKISCLGPYIFTDGVWEWPNELSYYVKNYHVSMTEDFITHMKENKWRVKKLTQNEILEICKRDRQ